MARVTAEDCIEKIPSRFEIVLVASMIANDIAAGMPLVIDRDRDKNPVVALRIIASDHADIPQLREALIRKLQTRSSVDQFDDENNNRESSDLTADMEYIPENSDIYVSDDHSDLDNDNMFSDDIVDDMD